MNSVRTGPDESAGAWAQSAELTFRFLFVLVSVLAVGWIFSNCRQVRPDSRAVVLRFGSVVREAGPGLLLALPRPIERVVVLPSADRQIAFRTDMTRAQDDAADPSPWAAASPAASISADPRQNAGVLLTGDMSVIHLTTTLYYRIDDPRAYVLSAEHVGPALARLLSASLMAVSARRDLDTIMVARPELAGVDTVGASRETLRSDLTAEINRRLQDLADRGAGLGVRASRVDVVPGIPIEAKNDFDSVLVAVQQAQTRIANARTQAEAATQQANQNRDRVLADAQAKAAERVSRANTRTAAIAALSRDSPESAERLPARRAFQEQVGTVLGRAGRVYVTDKRGEARLILRGGAPQ